eukprot:Skav227019  [mRNA]  locus=scaffold456:104800:115871:+ [translate_table: standard]
MGFQTDPRWENWEGDFRLSFARRNNLPDEISGLSAVLVWSGGHGDSICQYLVMLCHILSLSSWNCFDVFLAATGTIDVIIRAVMQNAPEILGAQSVLRLCRLVRLVRIIKAFRLKCMGDLRLMAAEQQRIDIDVKGWLAGLWTLSLAFTLLFTVIYVISGFATMTIGSSPETAKLGQAWTHERKEFTKEILNPSQDKKKNKESEKMPYKEKAKKGKKTQWGQGHLPTLLCFVLLLLLCCALPCCHASHMAVPCGRQVASLSSVVVTDDFNFSPVCGLPRCDSEGAMASCHVPIRNAEVDAAAREWRPNAKWPLQDLLGTWQLTWFQPVVTPNLFDLGRWQKNRWAKPSATKHVWRSEKVGQSRAWTGSWSAAQKPPAAAAGPKLAAKVQTLEWSLRPNLGTLSQARKALENGETMDFNLIIAKDAEVQKEIQRLWSAFACTKPVTVKGQQVSVWWGLSKLRTRKPWRGKVQLWQVAQVAGPIPLKGQTVEIDIPENPKPPLSYRKAVPGLESPDNPQWLIGEGAQLLGCRATVLCGGTWQQLQRKHTDHRSACKEKQDLVSWVRKLPEESAEEYFKRAQIQAKAKGKPLVLRQGSQTDLGIAGDEILTFLKKTGWKEAELRFVLRFGGPDFAWIFRTAPAPLQNNDDQGLYWRFCGTGGKCAFTIIPEKKGKSKEVPSAWLKAPKHNRNWNYDCRPTNGGARVPTETTEVLATQIDSAFQNPEQSPSQAGQEDRQRSPRRQTQAAAAPAGDPSQQAANPKQACLVAYPGWSVVDCQGAGDCGFRTSAKGIAYNQNKPIRGTDAP